MDRTNEETSDESLAGKIGAEFEENTPSVKVNDKPRVKKPEFDGEEASDKLPEKEERTLPTRSNTVTPDVTKEEVAPEETKASAGAAIDEIAKVAADKKAKKNDNEEVASHVQALVDNKTYFVPIGQVSKRRNTIAFVVIMLLLVLAILIVFIVF